MMRPSNGGVVVRSHRVSRFWCMSVTVAKRGAYDAILRPDMGSGEGFRD
jgi:hypothetical protein